MGTRNDPVWVIDSRTIEGPSQEVPTSIAGKWRGADFADQGLASPIEVFQAPW
jgi:hypothetical protein